MANSETVTSTSNTVGGEYQVFLSFRGPDTRLSFTDILHQALVDARVRVFIDDKGLQHGEKISNLLQAIDNCKLYIPIFSKDYVSSHWCLDELAKMVENTSKHKEDGKEKVILPIFYDVKPKDVKLGTPVYEDVITNLERKVEDQEHKFSSENIKTWRESLKEVGGIKGWEVQKHPSPLRLIQEIVDEVVAKLETKRRRVTGDLVGMKDQIAYIKKLLDIDSDDVRFIGIYGMGGVGKTTLAKTIFNELCPRFGRNCSFLDDVRETTAERKDIVKLQNKLLSDISYSGEAQNIANIDQGIDTIEATIYNKKVLIVLDDVDEADKILQLIGEKSLYQGSRILVTTRDKKVLTNRKLKYEFKDYEMMGLIRKDALKLFSRHAFDKDSPPADYWAFSKGIVNTTCGLPLALQAIGSSLFGKKRELWEEWLERLQKTPHEDVLAKLKISYDALHRNEKQIFLDIACFFAGKSKTNPMYMWKACNLYPVDAIDVLINRCMIKELANNSLWMHDQFRDLGRKIAREERIGLWDEDDIICELRSTKNKESFQALYFSASWDRRTVTSEQIKSFPHLRILWLYDVICQGDFTDCLSELRWINLRYPYSGIDRAGRNQRLEATNVLHLENAVVVNLSGLDITEDVLQSLIEGARKLKVLTITYNRLINGIPTFREDSVLEELAISSFWSLKRIDHSIGKLKWLTHLIIDSCYRLRKLPEQIGKLHNLQHLSLNHCHDLIELPDSVSKLEKLMKLNVFGTSISRLPNSIGRLRSLLFINASCAQIEELPSTMSKLHQLKTLELKFHKIQELPKLPGSLTTLKLASSSSLTIPNLSDLTNLVELFLSDGSEIYGRSDIIQTCDLWWIGKLSKLIKLHFCFPNVRAPTTELCSLSQLKELTLHGLDLPTIEQLPSNLIVLKLYETRGKQEHLDGLPSSRKSRENKVCEQHDVQFPDVLESSERSSIQDCRSSERLVCQPEEPRCNEQQAPELIDHQREAFLFPSSLNMLIKCGLSGFPEVQDIRFVSPLESLEEFSVKECSSLKSLGGLSSSKNLKQLEIHQCPSLKVVEGIDELKFLRWLKIEGCRSLERVFDASRSKVRRSSKSMVHHPEERGCSELQAPELTDHCREAILFPSSRKMLKSFCLSESHEVQDIQFDSTFVSLEEISVRECSSLKSLDGLSNLKNLERLNIDQCSSLKSLGSLSNLKNLRIKIDQCPSLEVIEGIYELKSSCSLEISGCIFERIFDVLSSKEPDNCRILIPREKSSDDSEDDSELGYIEYFDTWESYREKILSRTKQAPGSEIETTNSETETGDPLQKTNQENKEKKRKRKTQSAKQQGRRKRRKLQQKAWVRLFHPIISLCRTRKMNRRRERARRSAKEQEKRKRGKSA